MKPLFLTYYLPQFHIFPENEEWWGKGFTEWTSVTKARPLFPGHYQPHLPADLGFYDLRVEETRIAQAELAQEAGIDAFCYWHYWFGGHKLMERPFEEVVATGKPDFPFCLNWANHSWYAKLWDKSGNDKLLIEQTYPGIEDYTAHFMDLLPAFKDKRYLRIDGRLVFGIYDPKGIPDLRIFMETWNRLAREHGLEGFHFFCHAFTNKDAQRFREEGFDTILMEYLFNRQRMMQWVGRLLWSSHFIPQIIRYKDYAKVVVNNFPDLPGIAPQILPNWDHTPRSGRRGYLMTGSTPQAFGRLVTRLLEKIATHHNQPPFVMIKSWNEWGEGNHLEPDQKFGRGYIEALRHAIEAATPKL